MTSSKWQNKLNFKRVETGGGGNCCFSSVACALNKTFDYHFNHKHIRKLLAITITAANSKAFRHVVHEDYRYHFPQGAEVLSPNWRIMKKQIMKSGRAFQGTNIILQWLVDFSEFCIKHEIGFVILTDHGPSHTQIIKNKNSKHYLLLYNDSQSSHWQAVCLNGEFYSLSPGAVEQLLAIV